jgi:class 3 adenylate cyclase/CHASE2 domain-containing sensor protein
MSTRLRTFIIAIALSLCASGIGVTLLLVDNDSIPLVHVVTDLQAHYAALNLGPSIGLGTPPYDNDDNKNPNMGIIRIDELTYGSNVKILHQYPFPRRVYGTLLQHLAKAGAKAVVFDLDFIDPAPNPHDDTAFASGIKEIPTVLAFTVNTTTSGSIGISPIAPVLAPHIAGSGYTTVDEPGGIFLGQPLRIRTFGGGANNNQIFYSLAAAAAQTYTGKPLAFASIPRDANGTFLLVAPRFTTQQLTTDSGNRVEEHAPSFAGRGVLSLSDAYSMSVSDLRQFAKGALIYIGDTAQGQGDFVQTARQANTPGLFANARIADQLMRGIYMRPVPLWLNILLIVMLPLLVSLSFNLPKTTWAIAISLIATIAYAYVNSAIFVEMLVWIDQVHVVLAMILATLFVGLYRVIYEGAQRRMVTNLFGMHVSPAIVDDILSHEDPRNALALKGKKVKATIFYSDIRGFTAMSETMTPEDIYAQLNEYFEEMCAIIFAYGGYVDKFIGDCVMAVFSAPYQTPDDAGNAVRAAVAQQKKILELAEKWKAQGKREFTVGMGINTGDVVMGNLGASSRMNYTVIGDNVNLAARLYNVAKAGEIIISDYTYQEVKNIVVGEEREPVTVKGKKDPIRIYNILDVKAGAPATNGAVTAQPATA